jgi:hypothetical protein
MKRLTCVAVAALCLAVCSVPTTAFSQTPSVVTTEVEFPHFNVISWNVDSGGADPHVVALRISEMKDVALWGFCEVRDERWAGLFEQAANGLEPGRFVQILSLTGGSDRSCILYDKTQFDCLGWFEFSWAGQPWYSRELHLRPGLVAHLCHRASKQQFYFMVNRIQGAAADKQAAALPEWASQQDIPVLAVGTYDFEYRPEAQSASVAGRRGYPALTGTGVFQWVMPDNPIPTVSRGDLGAIDDFVLLADSQHKLAARSLVIIQPEDFPDNDLTPDHRPVSTTLVIRTAGG